MTGRRYRKAVTFSFDDGVESDRRLIGLFDRYGLKCSFNLNSGILESQASWNYHGFTAKRPVHFDKTIYAGHEICLHGARHRNAAELDGPALCAEFDEDKKALEMLFHQPVTGAAYAFGAYSDAAVAHLRQLGILFARTVRSTHAFALPSDPLRLAPTCHFADPDVFALADAFLAADASEPMLFYIWGHSYELDGDHLWDHMERLCALLAGREDVLYATNTEALRYFHTTEAENTP